LSTVGVKTSKTPGASRAENVPAVKYEDREKSLGRRGRKKE